jgi:hypothetical protein
VNTHKAAEPNSGSSDQYLKARKRTSEDINKHSEKEHITQNSKP